jgi:hypothetical protein
VSRRGDLGEWGAVLPAWIERHPGLAVWPWLADSARLDFARHRAERAADAAIDLGSLQLLDTHDPDHLHLRLVPGTALLESSWPIGSIHAAHQLDASVADAAYAALRHLPGKTVMVVRQGFRATVLVLDDARWTRQLLAGGALGPALEHVGEGFDFGAWLARAVREAWLERIDHV